ncbi:tyrosine-type recombinase/integrase [Salegentibacter sediminis]|uniref:tyrosine-type recombinase/integrase n=1 Tax=Salegentibacter sediminis TaxID=1930251 RepID=UPI0018E2A9F2|nr:tyrosine-type recombinase/integrase [Salegentibacter sediminis]
MSVKLILRKVPKEPSKSYLFIRTIINRKSTFKSLGFKINTKNFRKSGDGVTSLEPNYKEINETIKRELNSIRGVGEKEYVREKLSKKHQILPYIEKVIENTPNQGTVNIRTSAKKKFQKYLESIDKLDLTFAQLTPHLLESFNMFMLKDGIKSNSANQYLQTLQLFVNYAKEDEEIKLPDNYNPFHRIKFKRSPVRNKALTKEELKIFSEKNWKKKKHNLYRDMFMFQLYGGGLRVSDVLTLTWDNLYVEDGNIILDYKTFKTNKRMIANLFHNGLEYLDLPLSRYFPDMTKKLKELYKKKEMFEESIKVKYYDLEEEEKLRDSPLEIYKAIAAGQFEDMYELIAKEKDYIILKSAIKEHEIILKRTNERLLDLYKEKIQEAHLKYPDELVFPFLWDEKKNQPTVNLKVELINEKDYEKINNERSKYNQQIKRMGKKLDIKTPISTHSSRHTFTQLLLESNVNTHYISMALGHNSIGTTELYRRTLATKDSLGLNQKIPSL